MTVHRVATLVHAHEHVLDDIFPGAPVAENERGQPDELAPVRPEHPGEVAAGMRARLHVDHTNCARRWLPAAAENYLHDDPARARRLSTYLAFEGKRSAGSFLPLEATP